MRTSALFLVAIIFASAYAAGTTFKTEVTEMMSSNAMAADAVDTVEKLLLELKDSIYQEQDEHDARWA